MARCSVCGTNSPESARYCANCGNVLGEAIGPSAYEVGRIAALDSIKSEILKWLGVPVAVVTAIAGVLGYFGVTNIINSEVQSRVEKEIDRNFATTTNEIMKRFIAISNEEGSIITLEKDAQHALAGLQESKKQLDASLSQIETQKGVLTDSIKDAVNKERELRQDIAAMKLGPFLAKLRYDFYHLREFAVSGYVDLEPSTNPDLEYLAYSEYVKLVGVSNDGIGPVQLERERASAQREPNGITGINIQFAVPVPEQSKIFGKKIDILSPIDGIQLVFHCDSKSRDRLETITKLIKGVYLTVLVNGRPLWQVQMTRPGLTVQASSEGDSAIFAINMKLKYYGDTLLSGYEALFTNAESQ